MNSDDAAMTELSPLRSVIELIRSLLKPSAQVYAMFRILLYIYI